MVYLGNEKGISLEKTRDAKLAVNLFNKQRLVSSARTYEYLNKLIS